MEDIDKTFNAAAADGRIQGAALLVEDLTGRHLTKLWSSQSPRGSSGEAPEKRPPVTPDTPMRIASASKLLTAIMVLQCVERGLASLDEGLEKLLPEVANLKVLTGFD
ncbi:Uu.00g069710.m01.CDS01 [Anthostomella pinea]|uniref:Uu.00g069710.m01.CDS01 n=1 Tax=Anthostomella pinea TaxID=933095 RepID=A0AAI8YNQ2_9PEZI|nr:Uu.00g069710.m01.CDS01 [Anthostomella pinea]